MVDTRICLSLVSYIYENHICIHLFPATAGLKGNEDQKRLAVHYTTSQRYQENVFIEGSRPQYLEDLHTEAQEGLKISQQEGQTRQEKHHYRYSMALTCVLYCLCEHK